MTTMLPHTWRPFGARVAATVLGVMLLALAVGVWVAFGADVRGRFTFFQKSTLIFLGLMGLACWLAIVRSRVTAQEDSLTIVNGYRKRRYEWSEIVNVFLKRGAPWAGADLSDGTSISMVAIQGSDGQRAIRAVQDLRELVAQHTPPDHDD